MHFFYLHIRSIFFAITKILKNPLDSTLNILTISSIIILLCSILVITDFKNQWQQDNNVYPQIIVYLKDEAKKDDISKLEDMLNKYHRKYIKNYKFISKSEGLQQLNQNKELEQITSEINANSTNPLPDVLIINTKTTHLKRLQELVDRIRSFSMVSEVDADNNYINKVNELTNFVQKVAILLQAAFISILVIVIYNMIRLQMLSRQDEILVSRLIGASDSFIMRPLTYYAALQIIISTFVSFFLVNAFINYINRLFLFSEHLFDHNFLIPNITPIQLTQLLGILVIFTVFAVFIAVRWVFKNSYSQ